MNLQVASPSFVPCVEPERAAPVPRSVSEATLVYAGANMQNMRPLPAGGADPARARHGKDSHAEPALDVTRETDKELVRRVQKGDKRAFDLLFTRYRHKIHGLVGR